MATEEERNDQMSSSLDHKFNKVWFFFRQFTDFICQIEKISGYVT